MPLEEVNEDRLALGCVPFGKMESYQPMVSVEAEETGLGSLDLNFVMVGVADEGFFPIGVQRGAQGSEVFGFESFQ